MRQPRFLRFLSKNQTGIASSTLIITVLLLIVIALAGALAFKFHEDRSLSSTNNTVPNNALPNTEPTGPADNSQTTKVAAHTLDEGNALVESTYQQYIQTQNNSRVGVEQGLELIKTRLTNELYTSLSAKYAGEASKDYIVCAQTIPSTFGVDSNTQAGGSADYTVNEMFGSTTVPVKVTVDLNQLLISNISCPN